MMTEKEFNDMILPLANSIYSFAKYLTRNDTDAADITQDVILKLWDNRQKLSGIKDLKAWTLRMTHNLCLDILKKQKPLYNEEQMLRHGDYDRDLQKLIENKNTLEAVKEIIDTLPPTQKEVLILREIEELEYDEIAQITGLGLNNIRVLLSRARTRIKDILIRKYNISKYEL